MLTIEELDAYCLSYLLPEPEVVSTPVVSTDLGKVIAKLMKEVAGKNGILSCNIKYLALAAGQAYKELAFAEELNINNRDVTLVDRKYQDGDERWFRRFPGIRVVTSGIFAFLTQPLEKDFTLVSVFGIEYSLKDSRRMKALISLLPNVLRRSGLVCIDPYDGAAMQEIWQQNRFQPLYNPAALPDSPIVYLFNP